MSRALEAAMERNGITFHWNKRVVACTADGGDKISLTLSSSESLTVDAVLVAAGRRSNTESLNLGAAGVTANIFVDEHFRTEAPHFCRRRRNWRFVTGD